MRHHWVWIVLALAAGSVARATIPELEAARSMEDRLAAAQSRPAALASLVDRRDVRRLSELALGAEDVAVRGWAVVGLARVGGPDADRALRTLTKPSEPPLVRTWAAAAQIQQAGTAAELQEMAALVQQMPALARPLELRATSLLQGDSAEELVRLSLHSALGPTVVAVAGTQASAEDLVRLIYTHPEDQIRRQAASLAGAVAQQGQRDAVTAAVVAALRVTSDHDRVPWEGGALYVPALTWEGDAARGLVHTLMAWWLRAEASGRADLTRQVWNNLYSYQLLTAAGYDMGLTADATQLVMKVRQVAGRKVAEQVVERAGVANDPRFDRVMR